MRLQTQPTPVTCVQTCLAMALDVPVEQVIRHYGPEPMNAKGLLNALTECGIQWNQLTQGTMLHTGFYFAVVPSLNHRGGMHQIVIAYDSGTGGMTVFDPAIGNRYKKDGSDLISWAELVAFYPGGRLPSSVRPTIVCLCGSTRFMEAFQRANLEETLAGRIVLSIGCNTKSDTDLLAAGELTEDLKRMLDELHKRKIDIADEVLVLNVGGYVGDSTRSEMEYARAKGKPIRWLEPA